MCMCVVESAFRIFDNYLEKKLKFIQSKKNEIHTIKKYILKISFLDYLKSGI